MWVNDPIKKKQLYNLLILQIIRFINPIDYSKNYVTKHATIISLNELSNVSVLEQILKMCLTQKQQLLNLKTIIIIECSSFVAL